MDKILISGLGVQALIGTRPEERTKKQELLVDLVLTGDFSRAGQSDDLRNAVDYRAVEEKFLALAEHSSFFLLEALAERAAQLCLEFPRVESVAVRIAKPGAALRTETVAVEIKRWRNPHRRGKITLQE